MPKSRCAEVYHFPATSTSPRIPPLPHKIYMLSRPKCEFASILFLPSKRHVKKTHLQFLFLFFFFLNILFSSCFYNTSWSSQSPRSLPAWMPTGESNGAWVVRHRVNIQYFFPFSYFGRYIVK